MEIIKYQNKHAEAILTAIKKDPDWQIFTNDEAIDLYRKALQNSITYVCYHNSVFRGYIRAFLDNGLAIYVSELFVIPKYRNQKIGRSLHRGC